MKHLSSRDVHDLRQEWRQLLKDDAKHREQEISELCSAHKVEDLQLQLEELESQDRALPAHVPALPRPDCAVCHLPITGAVAIPIDGAGVH